MATFTAGLFLDAFKTQLEARGNLSGVTVSTGGLGSDTPREAIVFDSVSSIEDDASMDYVQELYEAEGLIYISKAGKGETIIKSARDRALVLLKEVKDQVIADETANSTVTRVRFAGYDLEQDVADPPGRICSIRFRLEALALNQ